MPVPHGDQSGARHGRAGFGVDESAPILGEEIVPRNGSSSGAGRDGHRHCVEIDARQDVLHLTAGARQVFQPGVVGKPCRRHRGHDQEESEPCPEEAPSRSPSLGL